MRSVPRRATILTKYVEKSECSVFTRAGRLLCLLPGKVTRVNRCRFVSELN
jgi:hypothetical protein